MKARYAVLAALAAASAPALAMQQATAQAVAMAAPAAPATPAIAAPATTNAMLRVGTEIPLRLLEELTTKGKKLKVGQRFHMETAEPVLVQGVTVIPAGSPAVGEITDVRNKGMWGKSGHLSARILYLMVNGRQVRLTGTFDDKGTAGGIGAVAVSAIVIPIAGFFMTGTSAKVAMGSTVKSFVDEDVPLSFAAAAPPPLEVAAPPSAGAMAVAATAASGAPVLAQPTSTQRPAQVVPASAPSSSAPGPKSH